MCGLSLALSAGLVLCLSALADSLLALLNGCDLSGPPFGIAAFDEWQRGSIVRWCDGAEPEGSIGRAISGLYCIHRLRPAEGVAVGHQAAA